MFYKPKHSSSSSAKIKRKIGFLFTLVAVAVVCYSVTVYAYFQASVFNGGNTIRVGSYAAQVEILTADKTRLWSSDEKILDYGDRVPVELEAASYILRITNTGSLAFQYQVGLTAENVSLLYEVQNPPDDKLVLQTGQSIEYTFSWQDADTRPEPRLEFRTAFQNGVLQDPITPPSDAAAGVPADMEPASQQNTLQEGNTVSSVVSSVVSRDDGGASSPETEGTVSHPETSLPTAGEDEPLGDASSAPSVSSDEQAASVPAVSDTTSLTSGEGESVSRQETPADAESESR